MPVAASLLLGAAAILALALALASFTQFVLLDAETFDPEPGTLRNGATS